MNAERHIYTPLLPDLWGRAGCKIREDATYREYRSDGARLRSIKICTQCTNNCRFKLTDNLSEYVRVLIGAMPVDVPILNVATKLGDEFDDTE